MAPGASPKARLGPGASPLKEAWRRGRARVGAAVGAAIGRLTLFQRFMLLSLVILVVGSYIIGSYVAGEIKARVMHRTSAITALYVESFISPHLQELKTRRSISQVHFAHLDELLSTTSVGEKIVSFKLWDEHGRIVYASDHELIGQQFSVGQGLQEALSGEIRTAISDLDEEENRFERQRWSRLLETYAPVHAYESGDVIGVSELYQDPSELESEVGSSQRKGWLIVGGATAVMYLLLVGMVRGASNTIARQHQRLGRLARQNADLARRVQRTAAQKSETDERLLRRVAQDLHDGPAQDVSFALLRLESLEPQARQTAAAQPVEAELRLMHAALTGALKEMRQIYAGLYLPDIDSLSLREVMEQAAQEHRRKTGNRVTLTVATDLPIVDLPLKIALYRVTQEALNNAYLHAGVEEEEVELSFAGEALLLEVRDWGAGLDGSAAAREGGRERAPLGLRGMRERIELLGGTVEVTSRPGEGTTVRAMVPVSWEEGRGA